MSMIYILHFDVPLSHAQHYSGCTDNLKERLARHAFGAGSALTRHLAKIGAHWQLGGLYITSKANMRKHERYLKDQHNAARYCELCNPTTKVVPGTKAYSIAAVPFPSGSEQIKVSSDITPCTAADFRLVRSNELSSEQVEYAMQDIVRLMSVDKDALGFIPAGGNEGLLTLVKRGQLVLAYDETDLAGYCAMTMTKDRLNIHQACTRDEFRLLGVGRKMIDMIASSYPDRTLTAKVRADLGANEFWSAIGFKHVDQWRHKSSGNPINFYTKDPQ